MAGISADYAPGVSLTRSACKECDTHRTDEDGPSDLILRVLVPKDGVTGEAGTDTQSL